MPFDGATYRLPAASRALIDGRRRIANGWCGDGARSQDGVCAVVALSDAAEDHDAYVEANRWLLAAVKETGFVAGGVVEYNDSHDRDEVLAVYDRAIELVASCLAPR